MPTIHYFHELNTIQQLQARALIGDLQPEWHCYLTGAAGDTEKALPLNPVVETGSIELSTAARAVLASLDRREMEFVIRHAIGDWSELPSAEQLANQLAIDEGGVVASRFPVDSSTWVYVTTQANRRHTHVSVGRVIPPNRFPPVARPAQDNREVVRS
ncbi:hypothetical protein [Burkholderia cenocepacia]|uniref:hypothetical protein n=1 Tax=Burkholderia cenocepacia TaxID=95486 RepID=UPI00196B1F5E|nr:hypothetical protein [Burkholderia cenocepacia]MBN3506339.1 hypothetical protein [Burkholderia cenocepacia]MBR8029859.1 hypothetical protein [Burkholderia cenocepacia]MBR8172189.1 hypothetical protein [Burkholderia cenocepacia]